MIQTSLNFDAPPPSPAPPAADRHQPEALRRIEQQYNRRLLSRLLGGPIESDELKACKALFGKRPHARLHDIRAWLWACGYPRHVDPLRRTCLSAERGVYRWALTEGAAAIARAEGAR